MNFNIYNKGFLSATDDLYFLQLFEDYNDTDFNIHFSYKYDNPQLKKLRNFLPKHIFENCNNEFDKMIRLMVWVNKSLIEDGDTIPIQPFNSINILKRTFEEKITSNCWMHAVVLNEIFLSMGYKSRMIRCMPLDLRFNDCHCITIVYSDVFNKWIVFDSALCTYYTDGFRIPLGIQEMRRNIIENRKISMPLVRGHKSKCIEAYWIKNMMRFECHQCSEFGMEESHQDKNFYSLLPNKFRLVDKEIEDGQHKTKIYHTYSENAFWRE